MSVSVDDPHIHTPNPFSHLLTSISSYDGNVMLAAIISLLLVILFVLLLHVYAKWFLAQARHRSTQSPSLSHVFRPDHRFRHFHAFPFDAAAFPNSTPSKGLDPSVVSSIPLFVYKMEEEHKQGLLECVICLSPFEDGDVGRVLPKCAHGFHVECIDMWLHSHSNCPICRAPITATNIATTTADSQASSLETLQGELLNGENLINDSMVAPVDENDNNVSASSSSSSLTLPSSIGCSLKRMLSKNKSERKVFPSSNASELPPV